MAPTDATYMREFLAYDMYNSIGLPTTKYSYIRVFINNEPIGLFGLAENFKTPWVRNEFANGDKNYNQGALFVGDISAGKTAGLGNDDPSVVHDDTGFFVLKGSADLAYLGNNISLYQRGIYNIREKPSNKEPDFSRIMDLTKLIGDASNTTTDDSVVPLWEKMINVDSFLRGLALEILISNVDGYYGLANNYLLYDDPKTKCFYFSGQDLDLSMGMYTIPGLLSGNYREYINFNNRPLSKIFNVPKFKKTFEELLLHMTNTLMGEDVLISRIDQVYNMLSDDVEWDKSLPRKGQMKIIDLIGGNNTEMSPVQATAAKELLTYATHGPNFSQAVNGPMPNNITAILPLKVWARTKRSNLVKFFSQKPDQDKL
jgi:spore coat protein CotH